MDESKVKLTPAQSGLPSVPTTKILAMGNIPMPLTLEQRKALGHKEVSATVRLYLAGKIDQWWYRQDGHGVVFLMNVTSIDEARGLLESLPLGQAKLLKFDLLPLGPLSPLQVLLDHPQATGQKSPRQEGVKPAQPGTESLGFEELA